MDSSDGRRILSPRQSQMLGTDLNTDPIPKVLSPTASSVVSPMKPQETMPLLRQSQQSQGVNLSVNECDSPQQPNAGFKVETNAFTMKQSSLQSTVNSARPGNKTGYRHYLPRSSANKVITQGILGSRAQTVRPIIDRSSLEQSEDGQQSTHGGLGMLGPHNREPGQGNSPTANVMTIHVKNKIQTTRQNNNVSKGLKTSQQNHVYHGLTTASQVAGTVRHNMKSLVDHEGLKDLIVTSTPSPRAVPTQPVNNNASPNALIQNASPNRDIANQLAEDDGSRQKLLILGVVQNDSRPNLQSPNTVIDPDALSAALSSVKKRGRLQASPERFALEDVVAKMRISNDSSLQDDENAQGQNNTGTRNSVHLSTLIETRLAQHAEKAKNSVNTAMSTRNVDNLSQPENKGSTYAERLIELQKSSNIATQDLNRSEVHGKFNKSPVVTIENAVMTRTGSKEPDSQDQNATHNSGIPTSQVPYLASTQDLKIRIEEKQKLQSKIRMHSLNSPVKKRAPVNTSHGDRRFASLHTAGDVVKMMDSPTRQSATFVQKTDGTFMYQQYDNPFNVLSFNSSMPQPMMQSTASGYVDSLKQKFSKSPHRATRNGTDTRQAHEIESSSMQHEVLIGAASLDDNTLISQSEQNPLAGVQDDQPAERQKPTKEEQEATDKKYQQLNPHLPKKQVSKVATSQKRALLLEHLMRAPKLTTYAQLRRRELPNQQRISKHSRAGFHQRQFGSQGAATNATAMLSSMETGQESIIGGSPFGRQDIITSSFAINEAISANLYQTEAHTPHLQNSQPLKTSMPGYRNFPGKKRTVNRPLFETYQELQNKQNAANSRMITPNIRAEGPSVLKGSNLQQQNAVISQIRKQSLLSHANEELDQTIVNRVSRQPLAIHLQNSIKDSVNTNRMQGANSSVDSQELVINGTRQQTRNHVDSHPLNVQASFEIGNQSYQRRQVYPLGNLSNPIKSFIFSSPKQNKINSNQNTIPLSNDTSRSPIPIDPETFKSMNMQLPPNFDNSDQDMGSLQQSPVIRSRSRSNSSRNVGQIQSQVAASGQFAQVKQFIMSPRHLHVSLQQNNSKAVDAIKVDKDMRSSNPWNQVLRSAATQQNFELVGTGGMLNNPGSRQNASVDSVIKSGHSQQELGQNQQLALQSAHGGSSVQTVEQSPRVGRSNQTTVEKGTVTSAAAESGVNQESRDETEMLKKRNIDKLLKDGLNEGLKMGRHTQNERKSDIQNLKVVSKGMQHKTDTNALKSKSPNQADVAIKVNSIDIQVDDREGAKGVPPHCGVGSQIGSSVNDSNMTHYRVKSVVPDFSKAEKTTQELKQINKIAHFAPVLKAKSYRQSLMARNADIELGPSLRVSSQDEGRLQTDLDTSTNKINVGEYAIQTNQSSLMKDSDQGNEAFGEESVAEWSNDDQKVKVRQIGTVTKDDGECRIGSRAQQTQPPKEAMPTSSVMTTSDLDVISKSNMPGSPWVDTNSVQGLQPTYDQIQERQKFTRDLILDQAENNEGQTTTSEEINSELAGAMLKMDVKSLALYSKQENGMLDFVEQKTLEFLMIQASLPRLDHNTMVSEMQRNLDTKADRLMKDIAIQPKVKQSPRDTSGKPFELTQKKAKFLKGEVPTFMIRFKNKSEQKRYIRVAKCILSLPAQEDRQLQKTNADIQFTYMKIFRFLADTLSVAEFESLSYYHVSRLINCILALSSAIDNESGLQPFAGFPGDKPVSLRKFVCKALYLNYEQTKISQDFLMKDRNNIGRAGRPSLLRPLCTSSHEGKSPSMTNKYDIYDRYPEREVLKGNQFKLQGTTPETRVAEIQEKIAKQGRKIHSVEPGLPFVVKNSYVNRGKETNHRGNVLYKRI